MRPKVDPASIIHESDMDSLHIADDGWFYPLCTCGWRTGPMPDLKTAVDSLMGHAWRVGREMSQ